MKPILRDVHTGLYFQGGTTWTQNAADAFVYPDIEGALEAAYSSSIPSLELNLLLFDDPRYTVRVALNEFFQKPARHRQDCARHSTAVGFGRGLPLADGI